MRRARAFGTVAELTVGDFELRVLHSHLQQLAVLFVPHFPSGRGEGASHGGAMGCESTTAGARSCMESIWAHLRASFELID